MSIRGRENQNTGGRLARVWWGLFSFLGKLSVSKGLANQIDIVRVSQMELDPGRRFAEFTGKGLDGLLIGIVANVRGGPIFLRAAGVVKFDSTGHGMTHGARRRG